jgi:hypothetical protein
MNRTSTTARTENRGGKTELSGRGRCRVQGSRPRTRDPQVDLLGADQDNRHRLRMERSDLSNWLRDEEAEYILRRVALLHFPDRCPAGAGDTAPITFRFGSRTKQEPGCSRGATSAQGDLGELVDMRNLLQLIVPRSVPSVGPGPTKEASGTRDDQSSYQSIKPARDIPPTPGSDRSPSSELAKCRYALVYGLDLSIDVRNLGVAENHDVKGFLRVRLGHGTSRIAIVGVSSRAGKSTSTPAFSPMKYRTVAKGCSRSRNTDVMRAGYPFNTGLKHSFEQIARRSLI